MYLKQRLLTHHILFSSFSKVMNPNFYLDTWPPRIKTILSSLPCGCIWPCNYGQWDISRYYVSATWKGQLVCTLWSLFLFCPFFQSAAWNGGCDVWHSGCHAGHENEAHTLKDSGGVSWMEPVFLKASWAKSLYQSLVTYFCTCMWRTTVLGKLSGGSFISHGWI